MATISERLSQFALHLKFEELPLEAVRYAKHLLLDTLGVALGGYLSEPSRIAREVVRESGGVPEATVIGSGDRTACGQAALLNGIMVRYHDFCDVYHGITPCHPSENIPAALAVGERQHASGKEVLTAIVIGYECECRFTDVIPFDKLGWHHVTIGGYVVPLVAGRLLKLNAKQMAHAVGISGSVSHAFFGYGKETISMMKAMGYPLATQKGIQAAMLAQKGMTGPLGIIETFQETVAKGCDLALLNEGGEGLRILQSSIKPYAAAGIIQTPLSILMPLVNEKGMSPDQIESICVKTYAFAASRSAKPQAYRPQTREDADHSMPYCLAIALLEGALGMDQFRDEKWKDPRVIALMDRISVSSDPELEKLYPRALPAFLEVTTKEGRRYSGRLDYPKGHPQNPMSGEEVEAKFRSLASRFLSTHQADLIVEAVNHVEEVKEISALMRLLVL